MMRRLLVVALVLWAWPAQAAMTCLAANVSAVAINPASAAPTVVMPTAAPAGATLFLGFLNRTDETTTVSSVVGSVNATGWTASTNTPADSATNTFRQGIYYKVNASAGTDTVTVTFSGSISSQLVTGWCSDAGGAQTFGVEATVTQFGAGSTNLDSNTLSASAAGGLIGIITSNNAAASMAADGAGESFISAIAAGVRIYAFFQAVSGAGTEGLEVTSGTAVTAMFQVVNFLNAAAGSTCTGGLTLLGAGKC